jgi:hypothetical protein
MATKQFALPLDSQSIQSGDVKFAGLAFANLPADFCLSNIVSGSTNELNLATSKGGTVKNHIFTVSAQDGKASVTLSHSVLEGIKDDATGGDWDYVEATWTVGQINSPSVSAMTAVQANVVYNLFGWPPKDS